MTSTNKNFILEQQKKEVESDLEMAIQKAIRCGLNEQEIRELFELILEENNHVKSE